MPFASGGKPLHDDNLRATKLPAQIRVGAGRVTAQAVGECRQVFWLGMNGAYDTVISAILPKATELQWILQRS